MPSNSVKTYNSPRAHRQRVALGWSREKLAAEAELSTSTITQLENGNRLPSPDTLDRIAGALGFDVGELVR
jgi:transcriptional regulator with XRE-family HTH domain